MSTINDQTRRAWATRPGLTVAGFLASFAAAFGLGACFDGVDAEGLPCENNNQCGVGQSCVDGYCGGVFRCADGVTLISTSKVCDFVEDCDDGSDEVPSACPGGDTFPCDDGGEVDFAFVCDGIADCDDGSDESPELCAGVGANMCTDSDGDLWWDVGPTVPAPAMPSRLVIVDLVASPDPDLLMVGANGDQVELVSFDLNTNEPTVSELDQLVEFGAVLDFELANVSGMAGDRLDIVVAVDSDPAQLLVLKNNRPMAPEMYGMTTTLPALGPSNIRGIEIGAFDNQPGDDVAVIIDGVNPGRLVTSFGSPTSAENGGPYFTFTDIMFTETERIGYDTFLASGRSNVDGDNDSDLIVTGIEGGQAMLYVVRRVGLDELFSSWSIEAIELERPAPLMAIGRFEPMAPADGIVVADPPAGEVRTYVNTGMGNFMQAKVLDVGGEVSGLGLDDVNCDGRADILVNSPGNQEVLVYLGDGFGDVFDGAPIRVPVDGVPRGQIAVMTFDADNTLDIVSMSDPGNGLSGPQAQILLANFIAEGAGPSTPLRASP